jgi:REP element-mobilizing transposase RayT
VPRQPRIFIDGGIFHVYNRFAGGADVFSNDNEAERFLDLIREVRDRDDLTIFAWCVMSNHYHLALRSGPVPLSRTMGHVQARLSQGYNIDHRSTGPLWQSRFKAKLVDEPLYLNQLVLYIHLNPVSAGVVDEPADYPLSGHLELLRKTPGSLVDSEQTLSLFGGTLRTARRRYVKAMENAREVEWRTNLPGGLPWWGHEPDRPLDPAAPSTWIDEQGLSTGLDRPAINGEEFLTHAASVLGLAPGELTAAGSGHQITRLRSLVVALAVERWRLRPVDMAPLFRRRNDVVSRWVRWGADHRLNDADFRTSYDLLDRQMSALFSQES